MPDYYLIAEAVRTEGADTTAPDMYLGPRAARIVEALRSLEHGPWWPPLYDLLDATRNFYAGGLTGTELTL